MRILEVVPHFYPAWSLGGIARVTYEISRELAKRGHEVTVHTTNVLDQRTDFKTSKREYQIEGMKVRYYRNLTKFGGLNFSSDALGSSTLKEIQDSDIINMHGFRTFQNLVVNHYAKKYNVPYVLHVHGALSGVGKQRVKLVYDVFFGYRLLSCASKLIALSQMEALQYSDMGVSDEKIVVIPNGIDLSGYADLPSKGYFKKKFNIEENKKIILYLGRIHKIKGIDFLVKAYAYLTKNMKLNDAMLVIAGPDDGYLTEAKRLTVSLKVGDKVVFTGMLSEKEKISAYVDSSLVVNVEPRNAFGLVPLEAAACSTPVVVSKDNAISETICEGKFGFSIKYGDINELAETIERMLNNDELLREMGQKGRKFVFENCNWVDIVTKLEKVYKEAVAS